MMGKLNLACEIYAAFQFLIGNMFDLHHIIVELIAIGSAYAQASLELVDNCKIWGVVWI